MSEKKQSSVDWLQKAIFDKIHMNSNKTYGYIINKAKAMHRKEIEDSWLDGVGNWDSEKEAEQYYNETFEK